MCRFGPQSDELSLEEIQTSPCSTVAPTLALSVFFVALFSPFFPAARFKDFVAAWPDFGNFVVLPSSLDEEFIITVSRLRSLYALNTSEMINFHNLEFFSRNISHLPLTLPFRFSRCIQALHELAVRENDIIDTHVRTVRN